ncbi:MAG TPA: gephyrin-like molybdotransferase Glp [Candidatus Limnocylindria bacterium]|nr:gephyrin-like molybdotransferase Glp [Candidatus Limnocylindria bacterium]
MLSLDDARGQLLERAVLARGETVSITVAVGRVLVDPRVVAAVDVPAFANSAMDGFALRAADAPGPLRLTGQVAAGASSLPSVEPGSTVRIMTGAPMPPGADTVVPIEEAVEAADGVTVPTVVPSGAHVRPAAHDTRAGDEVCLPGPLTPAAIAVLASLGIGSLEVRRRPMVAVLSTGDELAGPGDDLRPGQIHDANTPALAAAVIEAGGQPLVLPRAPDEREAIEHALADAAARADLVVTSGGVSVGRHDHVREVLEERGELGFWRIAVQPGKPLAVGGLDGTTVIGLPGNPVSALVTFELFVRPFIRAALGLSGDGRLHLRARPDARIEKDAARRAFLRVVVSGDGDELRARAAGGQMSSQLRPMADANALLVVPEGPDAAEPERTYEAIMLGPIRDVA